MGWTVMCSAHESNKTGTALLVTDMVIPLIIGGAKLNEYCFDIYSMRPTKHDVSQCRIESDLN